MRCKNCGSENDESLYICQNCGSPLYDEEEAPEEELGSTQVFSAQKMPENKPSPVRPEENADDKKKKQTTIIIIVLCVVLVAIIAGTVIAVVAAKNKKADETSSLTQVSTSQKTTTEPTTNKTVNDVTTEASTTTETTTEATTKEEKLKVTLSFNDNGEVEGDGEYSLGENVTIIARPDDGYTFDGWYDGTTKVSSSEAYTFTITKNVSLKAIFSIYNPEESEVENIGDDED